MTEQRNDPSSSEPRYASDEVDLLELFAILWEGKWIIAGITILVGLVAFFVVKAMPAIYRVEAVVGAPSSYNIQALQPSVLVAQEDPGKDSRASASVPYQVRPFDVDVLYTIATAQAQSLNTKKAFWEQRLGRPIVLAGANAEEKPENEAFRGFVKNFRVSMPESAGAFARVTLDTTDPQAGVELMTSYLRFVDQSALQRITRQLDSAFENSLARLAIDQAALQREEKLKLEDELVRLNEAHKAAQSLNIIDTPYDQIENIQLTLLNDREYLLGTTVLEQQITAINTRLEGSLEAFVPTLRRMDRWREQMIGDQERLHSAAADVDALVVVNPPEASLGPVAPRKPLIFLAVVFVAGISSVIVVFVRHGIRGYRAREATSASS